MKVKSIKNRIDAGFTLIEILVTIFLVGVALVGVVSFFNTSIASQTESKNEIIAAGLAQEGAELARNLVEYKRLNASLTSDTWTTIANSMPGCSRIDYRSLSGNPHGCNNGANNYVCLSSGRHQQCNGGMGIGMQRTLAITHTVDANGDRIVVQVNVIWNDRTTTARDIIYENTY